MGVARLDSLSIEQDYIALFGSGTSINTMPQAEFDYLKSRAFVITTNYAPIRLAGHLNVWSDRKVSDFLDQHYKQHDKDCLFLAQEHRVGGTLLQKVDFFFNRRVEGLKGNYTLVWVLQLIKKYFPTKQILLFGVDMYAPNSEQGKWYDSFTDFDARKRGTRYNVQSKLKQCAQQFRTYIDPKNIVNCNPKSKLDCFEKKPWQLLLPLNIVHLAASPLAGAPVHLSTCLNKYSNSTSSAVLRKPFARTGRWSNLHWPYDVLAPDNNELKQLTSTADVLHQHGRPYGAGIGNTPSVLQYHSPPRGYKAQATHSNYNGKKLVIAQYHPRFYTDALIVPNMIDIWDEAHQPGEKPTDKVVIFYSWATEQRGSWSDKGSAQTQAILAQIAEKYGSKVEIIVKNNRPYQECLEAKRRSHICIDECVTGSYHLQSLEGCAAGAVTFNNIDSTTQGFIDQITGGAEHPFQVTRLDELFKKLCHYIDQPEALLAGGLAARSWMERHWNPKRLVFHFLQAYYNVLMHAAVGAQSNEWPAPQEGILQAKDVVAAKRKPVPRTPRAAVTARQRRQARKNSAVATPTVAQQPGRQVILLSTKPEVVAKNKSPRPTPQQPGRSPKRRGTRSSRNGAEAKNDLAVPDTSHQTLVAISGQPLLLLYRCHPNTTFYILGPNANPAQWQPRNGIQLSTHEQHAGTPGINYHLGTSIADIQFLLNEVEPQTLLIPGSVPNNRPEMSAAQLQALQHTCHQAHVFSMRKPGTGPLPQHALSLEKEALMMRGNPELLAIHLAAWLGASRIVLLGDVPGTRDSQTLSIKAKTTANQTRWVIRQLRERYSVEVVNEAGRWLG